MPIKVKLVALLILISGFAHAADKKDAFIKAIDYCNCRIANTYCKQYSGMKPASPEKKSYDLIKNSFNCAIGSTKPFNDVCSMLSINRFETISKSCLTVFTKLSQTDVEHLGSNEAVAQIIDGIYNSAELKSIISQYSEVASLKVPLTKEITDYLSQSFGAVEGNGVQQPETELQKEAKRLESLIAENKTSPFAINWLSIILMAVFSTVVFFILKNKLAVLNKRSDRHRNELNSIDTKMSGNNFPQPTFQNSNFNDFKKSAERNISDLNSAITSLQSDVARLNIKLQGNFEPSQPTPQDEKQQRIETLYAPIPNKDGSFTATNVTSIENQSSSFFKFTITDNLSQKATFEFLNVERAVKDATSSPELILNPVCRIKNALNQNAKRIRTVTPGVVVKHNDKWILEKPAEIEYE